MIDKETILRIARDSGFPKAILDFAPTAIEHFATAILAHRAESGVEVPEPVYRHYGKGLNPVIGFDLKQLLNYGNARAAEALERAAKKAENASSTADGADIAEQIRSLTP